jgi:hypothetical protein
LVTFTLTISKPGSTFPVTATIVDQWSPPLAISEIYSVPPNCQGSLGTLALSTGIISCTNVGLTGTTTADFALEIVLRTSAFYVGALQNQASVMVAEPEIVDPPENNTAQVEVNVRTTSGFWIYLPIILMFTMVSLYSLQ